MTKIQVLKYNQSFMTWIGIYSYNLIETTNEFISSPIAWFIVINLLIVMISSAVFIQKNLSDFKAALETLLVIVAAIQSLGAYLNIASNMDKVKAVHFKLQEIVDQSMFFFVLLTLFLAKIGKKYHSKFIEL